MPTAWFVFLSALPLPTSSEDNFPFQWEANLWKRRGGGNQKNWGLLTAELFQWKCRQWFLTCYRKRKEKVDTKQRKVKCFKIAIGFSVNSQTFHLGYFSLPNSCLDIPVQCHHTFYKGQEISKEEGEPSRTLLSLPLPQIFTKQTFSSIKQEAYASETATEWVKCK